MKTNYFKYWLLLLLIFWGQQNLYAEIIQPIRVDSEFTRTSLNNHYALFVTPNQISADSIYQIFKEKHANKETQQITSTIKDFHWLFFSIENISASTKELIIDFNNAHVDTIELFRIDDTSAIPTRVGFGGDKMPFFEREGINRRFIFEEDLQPGDYKRYLLKIDQRYSTVSYPLALWEKTSFMYSDNWETLVLSLYFGGLFFISLFSFITGYIVNQKLFMYYAFYTVMMGIFQSANLGLLFKHFYPYNYALKNIFHVAMIPIMLMSFIEFSIQFLRIRKKHKALDNAIYFYYALAVSYILLIFFAYKPNNLFFFSYYVHFLIFLTVVLVIVFSVTSYRSKLRKLAKVYISADLIMVIGGIVMLLDDSGFISYRFIQSKAMIFGSMIELTIFTIAIIIGIKQLYEKRNELLSETATHRRKLLQATVKGKDEESSRISKEIHDDIGSRLALLKNQIILENTDKQELLKNVNALSESIRKISHELSPFNTLIIGLEQRLEQFLKEFSNNTGLKINFYYDVTFKIENNIAQQIFRILQEATRNCSTHAKATELDIQIISHVSEISISIDDNGIGFDKTMPNNDGNGIQNMISRTESVNGKFELSSGPNEGTHILISIPIGTNSG